ncbi:OmpA family protein [Thioalkalivibrio sp.]|uniref:OmpA family protein n=1 Tax=Thioalkalivibrio sp. TaxID=2093813 RepID=UPI0035661D1E
MHGKKIKNFLALSVAGLAMSGMASVNAQPAANPADTTGQAVVDGSGDCVRTTQWSPEGVTHEYCEGYIQPVAEEAPAPAPPPPAPAPEFTTTTLSAETLFDFDSATLRSEGRETLSELAESLTAADVTYTSVLVEGHTCNIGPAEYNQTLSERRAESVVDYLESEGVRPDAIRMVGYGEERPTADNSTREGRELNRRVEVTTDVRQRVR